MLLVVGWRRWYGWGGVGWGKVVGYQIRATSCLQTTMVLWLNFGHHKPCLGCLVGMKGDLVSSAGHHTSLTPSFVITTPSHAPLSPALVPRTPIQKVQTQAVDVSTLFSIIPKGSLLLCLDNTIKTILSGVLSSAINPQPFGLPPLISIPSSFLLKHQARPQLQPSVAGE